MDCLMRIYIYYSHDWKPPLRRILLHRESGPMVAMFRPTPLSRLSASLFGSATPGGRIRGLDRWILAK